MCPLPFLSPHRDRVTRQVGKEDVGEGAGRDARRAARSDVPVFVATYQWAAMLRFHGIDARQIDGLTRPSHFTQRPGAPGRPRPGATCSPTGSCRRSSSAGFDPPQIVRRFPLVVRGRGGGRVLGCSNTPSRGARAGTRAPLPRRADLTRPRTDLQR